MSDPENIIYNVTVIGNFTVSFDNEDENIVPLSTFEGDIELGKSSKTGNVTVYKDGNATTFTQDKLIYISGVTSDIQTQINTVSTNVSNNASNISNNAGNIATNSTNIANNSSNIATNVTNISKNTFNIANNSSNIATNVTNISKNTSNITDNARNIATNVTNISNNASNIANNTRNIVTNATNISNNTSNISTNTTNIATINSKVNSLIFRVTTLTSDTTLSFPLTNNFFIINSRSQITITLPALTDSSNVGKILYFKNICNKTTTIQVGDGNDKMYANKFNNNNDSDTDDDDDDNANSPSYLLRKTKLAVFYCTGSDSWCVSN